MEWTSSDVPGDESPHCSFCDKQIGIGCDAIALRTGKVRTSGRLYRFYPSLFEDEEDVRWFHFSCLETVLNFADASEQDDLTDCAFCPEDLLGESECYELELGQFDIREPDTWWEETLNRGEPVRTCACKECIEFAVGDGDGAEMRRRLGKKPLPQDKVKWINYNEVPPNMMGDQEEICPPPHLRRRGRRPPARY
jgi:hypothetical protein